MYCKYLVIILAVLRPGYTVVNVNLLYIPRELEYQLNESSAEAIFVMENFATTLQQVLAHTKIKHTVVASMGDLMGAKGLIANLVVRYVKQMVPTYSLPDATSFKQVLSAASSLSLKSVDMTQTDIAFLHYTGGTTDVSKGATLSHRNVTANILQVKHGCLPTWRKAQRLINWSLFVRCRFITSSPLRLAICLAYAPGLLIC